MLTGIGISTAAEDNTGDEEDKQQDADNDDEDYEPMDRRAHHTVLICSIARRP